MALKYVPESPRYADPAKPKKITYSFILCLLLGYNAE